MHPDDIASYFDSPEYTPGYGHAGSVALVLERLPDDTYAWLREDSQNPHTPPTGPHIVDTSARLDDDDERYWLTEQGRDELHRALALDWLLKGGR